MILIKIKNIIDAWHLFCLSRGKEAKVENSPFSNMQAVTARRAGK
jgi:hypothetical protein